MDLEEVGFTLAQELFEIGFSLSKDLHCPFMTLRLQSLDLRIHINLVSYQERDTKGFSMHSCTTNGHMLFCVYLVLVNCNCCDV